MQNHADKNTEPQSKPAAHELSKKQNGSASMQVADNRPEAIAQRKLQVAANNSMQVKQLMVYQKMVAPTGATTQPTNASAGDGKYTFTTVGETWTFVRLEKRQSDLYILHFTNEIGTKAEVHNHAGTTFVTAVDITETQKKGRHDSTEKCNPHLHAAALKHLQANPTTAPTGPTQGSVNSQAVIPGEAAKKFGELAASAGTGTYKPGAFSKQSQAKQ